MNLEEPNICCQHISNSKHKFVCEQQGAISTVCLQTFQENLCLEMFRLWFIHQG